ncbi:MAG TPA: hypothetical protein VKP64_13115 [Mycobacteriales bacterium]|nr:hypothetical protein [Mycobacteriales bacterium]
MISEGASARATEHASAISESAAPVSCTVVTPGVLARRYRTVWVFPVPGGP